MTITCSSALVNVQSAVYDFDVDLGSVRYWTTNVQTSQCFIDFLYSSLKRVI